MRLGWPFGVSVTGAVSPPSRVVRHQGPRAEGAAATRPLSAGHRPLPVHALLCAAGGGRAARAVLPGRAAATRGDAPEVARPAPTEDHCALALSGPGRW